MTHHSRRARKRRTLTRKERSAIVELLRLAPKLSGFDLTQDEFFKLALELERSTIIIDGPQSRLELERVSLRGSDSLSDPRD